MFTEPSSLLNKRELTEMLCEKMKARYPNHLFEIADANHVDNIHIRVTGIDGHSFACYTDSIYALYEQHPDELDLLCANMLQTLDSIITQDKETAPVLLPSIKNQTWINSIEHHQPNKLVFESGMQPNALDLHPRNLVNIALVDNLFIVFVMDTPKYMNYVFKEDLARLAKDGDVRTLYAQALDNLRQFIPRIQFESSAIGLSLHVDANYNASMILLYDEWKDKLTLEGNPVIALLARDTLLIADDANPQQLQSLQKFVQKIYPDIAYGLSPSLYTIRHSMLTSYAPKAKEPES